MSVTRDKRQVWSESARAGILVVDDDPAVASSVSELLQQHGYRTVLASDTDDARRRLRQGGVNLVVCDVRLPSESGLSLAQEIACDHPEVGVVMMSGWGDLRTADHHDAVCLKEAADGIKHRRVVVNEHTGERVLIHRPHSVGVNAAARPAWSWVRASNTFTTASVRLSIRIASPATTALVSPATGG